MDEHGNVPTGDDRPTAIEVDGPAHFHFLLPDLEATPSPVSLTKRRLLEQRGWTVVSVPFSEVAGASRKDQNKFVRKLLRDVFV